MSERIKFQLYRNYVTDTVDEIERVFHFVKNDFSEIQREKIRETLIEARSMIADMHFTPFHTREARVSFGHKFHHLLEKLKIN